MLLFHHQSQKQKSKRDDRAREKDHQHDECNEKHHDHINNAGLRYCGFCIDAGRTTAKRAMHDLRWLACKRLHPARNLRVIEWCRLILRIILRRRRVGIRNGLFLTDNSTIPAEQGIVKKLFSALCAIGQVLNLLTESVPRRGKLTLKMTLRNFITMIWLFQKPRRYRSASYIDDQSDNL